MSDVSEPDNTSQSSLYSCYSNSDLPPLAYRLEGRFSVDSGIHLKDLPELKRRSAVIIASHLMYNTNDSWKKIRPYLAACLYKYMSTYSPRCSSAFQQVSSIPSWSLLLDIKAIIVDEDMRSLQLQPMMTDVENCLEMVLANSCVAVISYKLSMSCELDMERAVGFKITPEPHFGWSELIDDVDKEHVKAKLDKFSGSLADWAICFDVRCNMATYVKCSEE